MLKLTPTLAICLLLSITFFQCSKSTDQKDDSTGQADEPKEWKEMDDFHMIMAEVFHPYKDSANLQPIKERAQELVAEADRWANASLPDKVNNDDVKEKLQKLKSESEALRDIVQQGNDQAIGERLTVVHDLFHAIQEEWYGGGHGHGHEHGH